MTFSRREFFKAASGALVMASAPFILKTAGIAGEEPIRVGNILDKTGGLNIYSLKQMQALAMTLEEINKSGGLIGRPLELHFYDSQSDNQFNSKYATDALVKDKVKVIHGGITSSSREVMRPIVDKFKGLLFYNSLYEGGVCDRRHASTGMVPAQQLEPLIQYVVKDKGAKRGYILAADYNYGHITSKWMQKFIRDNGGEDLAVEFFPLDVTNFAPAISRIQAAKPDVVWSALVGGAHIAFYRQFEATIGKKNMMLASSTYGVGLEQLQLSPEEGDGIVLATSFIDSLPTAKDFIAKFKAYSGDQSYVGEYGEYGARGLSIWAEAVKQAKSAEPDAVIDALSKGGVKVNGAGGLYTVDGQTNHTTMDIHLVVGNKTQSFDLIKSFPQRPPSDTQMVCDLHKNPNDAQQYEIKL